MVALVSALMINMCGLEAAIAQDVAGIKLGDMRGIEDSINPRAKPQVRVFYEDNQVVGVIYRQPGLSNERKKPVSLRESYLQKYGRQPLLRGKILQIANQMENEDKSWVGFSSFTLWTVVFKPRCREAIFSFFPKLMVKLRCERRLRAAQVASKAIQ